ncbi:MAG: glycogen debranching protein GlgX [bacterium]
MPEKLKHRTNKKLSGGKYYPLGATLQKDGVNFAIYSQHADDIFLLLFDDPAGEPADIIKIEHREKNVWHVFVHGLKKGQLYGFKIRGEFDPAKGMRFNENKLLIDPYSKALTGKFTNENNLLFGYDADSLDKDLSKDNRDNSHIVPKSIVMDEHFDWQNDSRPDIPFDKLIIYEVHLKGFTAHSSSGVKHPGTYLGFIEKIPYLKGLGINVVEFLPLQEFYTEDFLIKKGLTNYWGYNTIGFFSPESSYSSKSYPGCQADEFKILVRELHKAGIEVIMDVVYNHTGEGNELGPTICFRGIDNLTYYCLKGKKEEPYRSYTNYSGCGNSLNLANQAVIELIMDSLRYWVNIMHVDGFRFDLATILGRKDGLFQKTASFFDAISQDPVLNRVKLIAEPWDLETYQVGNFPPDWSEWNGKFRDTVRKFGRGDKGQVRDLSLRLTGSSDLYGDDGRSPYHSINFITCHDGFTVNDLVSYNHKHNELNFENNKDGLTENFSWNCGIEGETDDVNVVCLRKRLIKNYFCYLLFSLGTPMILGGDEFLRSQKGNNNAYCQDNEISWFNWELILKNKDIFDFCRKAILFRKKHIILQNRKFMEKLYDGLIIKWYGNDGREPVWGNHDARILCYILDGIFFICNADSFLQYVKLPCCSANKRWHRVIDTSLPGSEDFLDGGKEILIKPDDYYLVNPRSIVVLIAG